MSLKNPQSELIKKKIQENEDFFNNPLIQKLKDEKYWTVSDKEKKPLNANALLRGEYQLASFQNENPMVTLTELHNNPNLTITNRAYWVHSKTNHVIALDIEKTASEDFKQLMLQLPCDYAETSMSGQGIHMFIEIPENSMIPEANYLFNDISVLKTDDKTLEIIFNNHYITITKYQIPYIQRIDGNENHELQLRNFLKYVVDMDKNNKDKRQRAKALRESLISTDELSEFGQLLVDKLTDIPFNKTPQDYHNDLSAYEMGMAVFYAGQIETIKKNIRKQKAVTLLNLLKEYSDEESILVIYEVLQNNLEYREKHDEYRDDMPWLMYRAKDGLSYVLSSKKKGKK